mmetsp:Transcript_63003/g.115926  ORF Transcript_63003/g.115926 Transcript_63003/m.115926 type:complete len:883 (+) Transcript_63003:65-2713(+)
MIKTLPTGRTSMEAVLYSSESMDTLAGPGCFLADAIWVSMIVFSETLNHQGMNFSAYDGFLKLVGTSTNSWTGSLEFNPATGDRYREGTLATIRQGATCNNASIACHELHSCTYSTQEDCLPHWEQCMKNQPWQTNRGKVHPVGMFRRDTFDSNGLEIQYHSCGALKPPANDPTCGSGQFFDVILNICQVCPRGRQGTLLFTRLCEDCVAGRFGRNTNTSQCSLCPPGKFTSDRGASECVKCGKGSYAREHGSAFCAKCAHGTFADQEASATCMLCDRGRFQNVSGQSFCMLCKHHRTTAARGMVHQTECTCHVGYVFEKQRDRCQLCSTLYTTQSVLCPGYGARPIIQPTFMALPMQSSRVYLCQSARACKGGVSFNESSCSGNTLGIACGRCENTAEAKFVRNAEGSCAECDENAYVLFTIVICVGACGLTMKLRPKTVIYSDRESLGACQGSFPINPITHYLDFMQFCAVLNGTKIKWPTQTKNSFNGMADIFNLSMFNLPCLLGGSLQNAALRQTIFLNLSPLMCIVFVTLACVPSVMFPGICKYRPPGVIQGINTILALLQTFFISILNFSLTMVFSFYKHPKSDLSSLVVFPYLLTTDTESQHMYVVAALALACWCVGSFLFFCFSVVVRSVKHDWLVFHRSTFAIAVKYKDSAIFWVLEDMVFKMILCTCGAMLDETAQIQTFGNLLLVHWLLMLLVQPHRFFVHFISEGFVNLMKVCLVLCSAACVLGENSDATPFMFVIFAGSCGTFLVVARCVFEMLIRKNNTPSQDNQKIREIGYWMVQYLPKFTSLRSLVGQQDNNDNEMNFAMLQGKIMMGVMQNVAIVTRAPTEAKASIMELISLQRSCIKSIVGSRHEIGKSHLQSQQTIISKLVKT